MKKLNTALLGLAMVLGTGQASAVSISVSSPSSVGLGGGFQIDVSVSGLDTLDLGAFDIDLSFDSSLLQFQGYTLGSELTDPLFGQIDLSLGEKAPGLINVAETSALFDFSAQPDSFTLATLSFTGSAVGTSPLDISFVDLRDDLAAPIANPDLSNAQVSVVPVPATLLLLLPFGLGLLASRRTPR